MRLRLLCLLALAASLGSCASNKPQKNMYAPLDIPQRKRPGMFTASGYSHLADMASRDTTTVR